MSINSPGVPSQTPEANRESNQTVIVSHELKTSVSGDPSVRKVVASELLAAISSENREIQQRARQLFIEHGYFDEAMRHLRESKDARDRVAAADTLGQFGSNLAAAALNAALFDEDPTVREAAQSAIERIESPRSAEKSLSNDEDNPNLEAKPSEREQQMLAVEEAETRSEERVRDIGTEMSNERHAPVLSAEMSDVNKLLLEENELRQKLDALEGNLLELDLALESARNEMQAANKSVLRFRAEIDDLRRQEEDVHRQIRTATDHFQAQIQKKTEADQDCRRFSAELVHVRAEADRVTAAMLQVARKRAETCEARRVEAENARRMADELYNNELLQLRSEEAALRQAAEKAALRRAEVREARLALQEQTTQLLEQENGMSAPEAARLAQAERLHYEAEERHRSEQERLRIVVDKLNQLTEHVAARRANVEFATRVAEAEAEKLAEAQARLGAIEETHRTTEAEDADLEPQVLKPTPEPTSGVDEVVHEQELNHEIERLEETEIDIRRRIEQAELRRRGAEDACRQLEERAIKVEAEAHRSRLEEQQALAKLETARREATAEFEARAEQQKRIREDIDELRRLELEERQRVEAESLRRSQAEARLQQERERYNTEEAARLRIEAAESELNDQREITQAESGPNGDTVENLKRVALPADEALMTMGQDQPGEAKTDINDSVPEELTAALQSEDTDRRVAAVDKLATLGTTPALAVLVEAFDDDSSEVRNAAAMALHKADHEGAREWFTRAFESASRERQRNIGEAIVNSGLAGDMISALSRSNFDETHSALSLLLVMARAGEVQPLVDAIEEHKNLEVRRAAIRLLTLSGHTEVADAAVKRRLAGI